jgi:DHA1 family bicyclomycin/chloramphenicol resistance-like MFS transporter
MNVYGVSQKTYGWIFAMLSIGFIGSSQLNTLLLRKFKSHQILDVIIPVYVVFSLLFMIASQMGWLHLPLIIVFIFLFVLCGHCESQYGCVEHWHLSQTTPGQLPHSWEPSRWVWDHWISVFISLFEKPSVTPFSYCLCRVVGSFLMVA